MATAASAIGASVISSRNVPEDIPRRSANFHPSVWGDHFLQYASQSLVIYITLLIIQLKERFKLVILLKVTTPFIYYHTNVSILLDKLCCLVFLEINIDI